MTGWPRAVACPQLPQTRTGHALVHTVPQAMDSLREPVDDARCGQRIPFYQSAKLFPREFALTIPAVKPLKPSTFDLVMKPTQRGMVSGDPVVRVVSMEFLTQLEMLLADGPMSIESTPKRNALHCTPEATRRGLTFDGPVPFASLPPIMSETQQGERFRTCA